MRLSVFHSPVLNTLFEPQNELNVDDFLAADDPRAMREGWLHTHIERPIVS